MNDENPLLSVTNILDDDVQFDKIIDHFKSPDFSDNSVSQSDEIINGLMQYRDNRNVSALSVDILTVVKDVARPVFFIQNNEFTIPPSTFWSNEVALVQDKLRDFVKSCGCITYLKNRTRVIVGTAWYLGENRIMTNRHVAKYFITNNNKKIKENLNPQIDFYMEHQSNRKNSYRISQVDHVDGPEDLAVLKIETLPESEQTELTPLTFEDQNPTVDDQIAVIGYPTEVDISRSLPEVQKVFKGIFGVKRFQPGTVTRATDTSSGFAHDCSTQGGNSGSPVFSLSSGKVVGLHYSFDHRIENYAIRTKKIKEILQNKVQIQLA